MTQQFRQVAGHIEVYSESGEFLFSADTMQEAWAELMDCAFRFTGILRKLPIFHLPFSKKSSIMDTAKSVRWHTEYRNRRPLWNTEIRF